MSKAYWRWATGVAALLLLCACSEAGGRQTWTWTDRDQKKRSRADLDKILDDHKLWVKSDYKQGKRADLSGANLEKADLSGAHLSVADLSVADLSGAHLSVADLSGADLGGANLSLANLIGANLSGANLSLAYLIGANLEKAYLSGADLSEAHLSVADLSGANLNGADLKGALFYGADLNRAIFEPKSLSEISDIAGAKNLEFLTYETDSGPLAQLRKQFQDGGFRTQERKITYALNRKRAELDGPVEHWFKRVAFDWTCQYGMNPGRALAIWLGLLVPCWLVYTVFIHTPGESGIYRVEKAGRGEPAEPVEEQIRPGRIPSQPRWRYPLRWAGREVRVLFWAGFFSLMSAFNIGFREINFGRWLRLLTRTEYDLKAKGWARTVAGVQSLLSVYLIALWVLTYFGRPFE